MQVTILENEKTAIDAFGNIYDILGVRLENKGPLYDIEDSFSKLVLTKGTVHNALAPDATKYEIEIRA